MRRIEKRRTLLVMCKPFGMLLLSGISQSSAPSTGQVLKLDMRMRYCQRKRNSLARDFEAEMASGGGLVAQRGGRPRKAKIAETC